MAADPGSSGGSPFDATFWVAVSFLVTLALLFVAKVHRRVLDALDGRTAKITAQLEQARNLRDEAHATLARQQRRQREAKAEAEDIVSQAERDARAMTEEAERHLEEVTKRREAVAEAKIAQAQQTAVNALREEAAAIAVAAARQVIAQEAGGKLGDELIGRTIEQIGSQPSR